MLILSLTAVARAPVRLQGQIPVDDSLWTEAGIVLEEPFEFDLEARTVGEGILVRGEVRAELEAGCRRCLVPVAVRIGDRIDLLFEPLTEEEEADLSGEVYPLPSRGDALDLAPAIREQFVLRIPDYVLCSETCRGLCPRCGAELNRIECGCVVEEYGSPWDVLKDIEFD